MKEKYAIHYHDERLSNPYQYVEIESADITEWKSNFISNNYPHITVMECYLA